MPAPAPAPTATATAAPGPAGSSESLADGESGKGTATPAQQIAAHLAQLQDARQNNDRRGVARVLHHLPALRRALHAALLLELCALPCVAGCLDGMDGVAQALQAQTATDAAQAGDTASALAGVSAEQSVERTAYALLLVAVLSMLQATLTLPGIAAMALALGVAIDSNVLINERIREELRNGATPQAAIAAAKSQGGVVVVDPKGKDYSIYRGVDLA